MSPDTIRSGSEHPGTVRRRAVRAPPVQRAGDPLAGQVRGRLPAGAGAGSSVSPWLAVSPVRSSAVLNRMGPTSSFSATVATAIAANPVPKPGMLLLDLRRDAERQPRLRHQSCPPPAPERGWIVREPAGQPRRRHGASRAGHHQGQGGGPELREERKVEVRPGGGKEDDEDDLPQPFDLLEELVPLRREVLHHEPGGDEDQQPVEAQVVQHLRHHQPERDEDQEQLPADEAEIRGQEQPEGRAERDAAQHLGDPARERPPARTPPRAR